MKAVYQDRVALYYVSLMKLEFCFLAIPALNCTRL